MGSFSWIRADICTKRANLTMGDKYKILVPEQFGGGYILDEYYDYGYIFPEEAKTGGTYIDGSGNKHTGFPENDLYGVLAYWNGAVVFPNNDGAEISMADILRKGNTKNQYIRCKGINIGCYDRQVDALKYPLKLVSRSCRDTYETCPGVSYGDINQGFYRGFWAQKDYQKYYVRIRQARARWRAENGLDTVGLDTTTT